MFHVLLVGPSLSSPSAHPSGPVKDIFAGKKLTRDGCPWGNIRNMTWTEKTTSNGTFQSPKFWPYWSNINSNAVRRIKSPIQICLTTSSVIPRLCNKKLPCPVIECGSQKTLDPWGKPPQTTPKSKCCFQQHTHPDTGTQPQVIKNVVSQHTHPKKRRETERDRTKKNKKKKKKQKKQKRKGRGQQHTHPDTGTPPQVRTW